MQQPGGHDETNAVRQWVGRFRKLGTMCVTVENREDPHDDGRDRERQTQSGRNGAPQYES